MNRKAGERTLRKEKIAPGIFHRDSLPLIMGILNITPDSFFDGGRYRGIEAAVFHGVKMAEDGADILDIGGESTRPGASPVTLEEELNRVIPVIAALKRETGLPISVDTCKSRVAAEAMDTGADIVNDISFGTFDDAMFTTVASGRAGYVGMHMQGTPGNMQKNPKYNDVVAEVKDFLQERAKLAIESGILPDKLAVDPGIGFGKNDEHNLDLLQKLKKLQGLGYPVLVGASRKSMIGRLLGLDVKSRLSPSLAIALFAADNGVSVVRVHDVFETKQALKMWELLSE